jgi:hypothetical protein
VPRAWPVYAVWDLILSVYFQFLLAIIIMSTKIRCPNLTLVIFDIVQEKTPSRKEEKEKQEGGPKTA